MSATQAPPAEQDFDAAVDAFLETSQRPSGERTADAPQADPSPDQGMAPAAGSAAPATAAAGEPDATAGAAATTGEEAPIDYKARYEELQQQITSEAGRELSAAGRLKKANEENARLKAERDDFERQVQSQNTRIDKWWEDAIEAAPEEQKAEYRRLYAIDQRERQIAQKEQQQELVNQQAQQRQAEIRQQAESAARFYATAELDTAIEARAKHEGMDPTLFQPVRDYINSPLVKKLVQTLPLRGTDLQGDPAAWDFERIDNLATLRTYLVRQAELGYDYYTRQHQTKAQQAEQARVAENAKAAEQTYRPEAVVGAGVGKQRRSWDELDFDEAVDSFLAANR